MSVTLRRLNLMIESRIRTLMEMSFIGATEHGPITILYSTKRLPSIVVNTRGAHTYDVLILKQVRTGILIHSLISTNQGTFAQAVAKAKELRIAKTHKEGMNGPQLIDFLMVKNGMPKGLFSRLFPNVGFSAEEGGKQKVGKFSVYGLVDKNSAKVEALIDKVSSLIQHAGFGHLLYGDIFVVGRGAISRHTGADYEATQDNIRIKMPLSSFEKEVESFIHELGHRQSAKFKTDQAAVSARFFQARAKSPSLHIGDRLRDPSSGLEFVVSGTKYVGRKLKYMGYYANNPSYPLLGDEGIAYWEKISSNDDKHEHDVLAVSQYSMTNPSEFFAEVFAVAVLGNNNAMQWIKEVASK